MIRFNIIVAMCENFGIGLKGELPWRLKSELKYFGDTTKRVSDTNKRNVLIMGKRTYFGIPANKRPLPERLNIVLSTTLKEHELPESVLLYPNLESALNRLEDDAALRESIESVWIVGGSGVYKEAMNSKRCHRLYITKIKTNIDCDTYFPKIPEDFKEVQPDEGTPRGEQHENGLAYEYTVYERKST